MKTPALAGLPSDKFTVWRKGQERALRDLLFSPDRFTLLCIPTGGGKTLVGMGYVGIDDGRAAYLTASRALQTQVVDDFRSMGLVDMRGRNNYTCNIDERYQADEAVCTGGTFCPLMRHGGCDYYDQRRAARDSRIVTTNYRYWLHDEESGGLGDFSTLILDEAHRCPDEISDFAAVEVDTGELARYRVAPPQRYERPEVWASRALHQVEQRSQHLPTHDERRKSKNLQRRLARLCRLSDEEWLASRPGRFRYRWDLVDPGALAEDLLFRGARRIILVSASVRRKTLRMLGVDGKIKTIEQESTFPVRNRPVYYWPVTKVGWKMTGGDRNVWHEAIDTIALPRLDRNGVIHCHSYDWGRQIYERADPEVRARMLLHKRGEEGEVVFAKFVARGKRKPTILVSPSMGTGVDMAYRIAEWQIIPKVPFPDFKSPLIAARKARDKEYIPYVTMQTIVQNAGRIVRATDDLGETFILDSNFGWLRNAHWDFAPRYFHAAIRTVGREDEPPPPPGRL